MKGIGKEFGLNIGTTSGARDKFKHTQEARGDSFIADALLR